jgi:hypothetical protein
MKRDPNDFLVRAAFADCTQFLTVSVALPSSFVVEGIALACSASQFPRFLQCLNHDEERVHEGRAGRRNAR